MNTIVSKMKSEDVLPTNIENYDSLCMGGTMGDTHTAFWKSFNSTYWSDITPLIVDRERNAPTVEEILLSENMRGILVIMTKHHNDYWGTIETSYSKYRVGGKPRKDSEEEKKRKKRAAHAAWLYETFDIL